MLLKTESQSKFTRDAIAHYLEIARTEISVNNIKDYISKHSQVNSKTGL